MKIEALSVLMHDWRKISSYDWIW